MDDRTIPQPYAELNPSLQTAISTYWYALNGGAPWWQNKPESPITTAHSFPLGEKTLRGSKKSREDGLIDLIVQSVSKLTGRSEMYLALTGGWESTAILGAWYKLRADGLKTFTFGTESPPRYSDAYVAKQVTSAIGYQHEIWPIDRYTPLAVQEANAAMFEFRANRLPELGGWLWFRDNRAAALTTRPTFLFGDVNCGMGDCRIESDADLLHSLYLLSDCSPILPYLRTEYQKELQTIYPELIGGLLKTAKHLDNWHDKRDFLYFHYRSKYVVLPWRECFAAKFGNVELALCSQALADYVAMLPVEDRRGRSLFKSAVSRAFPEVFSFKRATCAGLPALPMLAPWPEKHSRENLIQICENLGLNRFFIEDVEQRAKSWQQPRKDIRYRLSRLRSWVDAQKPLAAIRGHIQRNKKPKPVAHDTVDRILSRLQMVVLALLQKQAFSEKQTLHS